MPVFATPDWVASPLAVIDNIFANDTARYQENILALRTDVDGAFEARIKNEKNDYRYLVPLINGLSREQLKIIPPQSLVRFRCMIQDERPSGYHQPLLQVRQTHSSETKLVCAMYKDGFVLKADEEVVSLGAPETLSEMRSLKCLPLPTETAWSHALSQHGNIGISHAAKNPTQPELIANFFVEAGSGIGINDAVEVFGVLVFREQMSEVDASGDASMPSAEVAEVAESSAEEVRLNVIFHETLIHTHPGLPFDKEGLLSLAKEDGFSFSDTRTALLDSLKTCLGGDALAAEYLLLHFISSVYSRPDGQALGNFPLNLTGVPQDVTFVKRLMTTLNTFVTQIASFSMSIGTLNASPLAPKMAERAGTVDSELLPGFLQLPKQTHLVLDELGMDIGMLNDVGCKNLLALQKLANEQKLDFDFLFGQRIPFQMDTPVLVLSQGKSLINCRCIVPLNPPTPMDQVSVPEDTVWNIRQYLVTAKFLNYEITDDMREAIVEKFVKARKVDRSVSPEDLHQQLELARYMTVSYGEAVLTKERWEQVLRLEEERCRRVKEGTGR